MHHPIDVVSIPFSPIFWNDVAERLIGGQPFADPIVVVDNQLQAQELRDALAQVLAARGVAVIVAPTIRVLETWAGTQRDALGAARTHSARQIELYEALTATPWLVEASGGDTSGFWALARQILLLCDQLTLSLGRPDASGTPPDIERRLLAFIRGTYRDRAWDACSAEAALVAQVWQLTLSRQDGAALLLRGLDRLAKSAMQPLMMVEAGAVPPYIESFVNQYALSQPVMRIRADVALTLTPVAPLAAAWPELIGEGESPDLRTRAQSLAANGQAIAHVTITGTSALEDEATCVCDHVLRWLADGRSRIGLVALDRLVARRVRALLERADVIVADESGWKLSTTTVAGALMRWLEVVSLGTLRCDSQLLLDWLKSPYALPEQLDKTGVLAEFELAVRDANVVRGFEAMRTALTKRAERSPEDLVRRQRVDAAHIVLNALEAQINAARGVQSYSGHFRWLSTTLTETGMASAFAADAAGTLLLEVIGQLAHDARAEGNWQRVSLRAWRDFVADALENSTFREGGVRSPVIATSLEGAALRRFDAVAFVGADAQHLPSKAREMLFLTPALGVELGLDDRRVVQQTELARIATLLAATPVALVTFQQGDSGNAHGLAGALERLSLIHKIAFGDDLKRDWQWARHAVKALPLPAPSPSAGAQIPARVSASGYNKLLSCPYRYFAQYVLRLEALEDVSEDVEKSEYGNLVHETLEAFHRRVGQDPVPDPQVMIALLREVTEAVFHARHAEHSVYLGYRARFEALVPSYVEWWHPRATQGWVVEELEQRYVREIALEDARVLTLDGRLDRADRMGEHWAIVDYKTSSKTRLADRMRVPGEDIQLPFYRLLLSDRHVTESFFLSVDRKPVAAVAAKGDIGELAEKVQQRLVANFSALHRGAPMPAQGDDGACKYCEHRGLCRKGHWAQDDLNQGAR